MNKLQRTVLVIEKQEDVRLALRQALSQAAGVDYLVIDAADDAQALTYLHQQQPDCLLLADTIVGCGGRTLLQQIVQHAAPQIYPIILLVDDANAVPALPAGVHDFLLKTEVTALPVQRAINHALDKVALLRQLAEQRAFNQMILESSPDCVKLLDAEGCLLSMNTPGLCLMEIDDFAPLAGQPWMTLWPVECSRLINAALVEARAGRQGRFQAFCPTAKGTPKWWDVIVTAVNPMDNDEAGAPVHFIAASRDITESYQWAETLRASEERQRLGMAVAGLIIADIDYTTDLVRLGPEAATLFGLPKDVGAVSRAPFYDLFHPADRDEFLRRIDIAHDPTGSGWFAMEQRIVRPTGEIRWLRVRKQVFFTENGSGIRCPHHALLAAIDITDRKRMELSLRQSEETARQRLAELEAIYDSAPIGLCVLDRDLRWMRINERLAEINGFPVQAHLGRSVRELLPDLAPTAEPILRMILADDQPMLNLELQGETPAQPGVERTWVEHMFPLHDSDGAVIGINVVAEEITERKRQERRLQELNATLERRVAERTQELEQKNHELERSNRELDKFAYVASHDLKSPLRAIDNLAQWIKEDASALLPEPSQAHLAKLQGRVRRMEKLLDDLLVYSRVGRLQYAPEVVDLKALLQNLIALLQPSAAFTITVTETLPTLRTQRVPLETVLRNLLDNAIKHHDRANGHVHIAAYDRSDWIEFVITDDGPGIDPQFHARIFEVFQTLQPRDKVEGSGMGLAIVKKSIESQGGTITVESSPGAGATFRFTWRKG